MIEAQFQIAMQNAGIKVLEPIITDGKLHRVYIVGDKQGSSNGWYIVFSDGVPSGAFGNWKKAFKGTWCAKARREMTYAEKAEFQQRMTIARQVRAKEEHALKQAVREKAITLWQAAIDIGGSPAQAYLKRRGIIQQPPLSLRFQPSCYHSKTKKHYPAMIAAVTRWPDNAPCAVHRTYLQGDKKADIQPNKMMLGAVTGGAVRLGSADLVIVVAEGIETALSVQQETGIPAWAVLSASNYKSLLLPRTIKEIIVAADHDAAGIKAAYEAAAQWARQGLTVKVVFPPVFGTDFNDLLIKE